jgi:hypothetical protein
VLAAITPQVRRELSFWVFPHIFFLKLYKKIVEFYMGYVVGLPKHASATSRWSQPKFSYSKYFSSSRRH